MGLTPKPELMSPAGHWPQLRAAIEAGADAVYFGLDHFSARAKVGFGQEELPEIMLALHERGVKGFVTFNTLVFDDEIDRADAAIEKMVHADVDAVIVQDIGMADRIHSLAPGLPIHGSTQMSVTTAQGCEMAREFGCSRVVLARELSLKDIRKIASTTDIELETFVHGALCVSYSGQCFSSEAWGGRSANRGQCAQACRLSYEMFVDGQYRDLGSNRYLLSPGDLYALEQIPELMEIGISCLKIEGRYKDENYVALTTAAYRKKIDEVWQEVDKPVDDETRQGLEQIYSRGLNPSFVAGVNHQTVVEGRAPRHRGILVGRVTRVDDHSVWIEPQANLSWPVGKGDGVVFDSADWRSPDLPEEGGNIFDLKQGGRGEVVLTFIRDAVDFSRIRVGDRVWRTSNPRLTKSIRNVSKPRAVQFTKPVDFRLRGTVGNRLEMEITLKCPIERQQPVRVASDAILTTAESRGLTRERLTEQFERLGGTAFHLESVQLENEAELAKCFIPVSELNEMRRRGVAKLIDARTSRRQPDSGFVATTTTHQNEWPRKPMRRQPAVHLLVRTPEQLEAAMDLRPDSITLDYLELYGLRPSIEKIQQAGLRARVASPRILKPSEQNVIKFLLSLDCDILVRSAGLLYDLLKLENRPRLIGDFSLNVANQLSARRLLERGVDQLTPTYDLNAQQINGLEESLGPEEFELIAYSHLPVFHTEHCVFCRFLSDGTDHTNCGHPCEKHRVQLRDHQGRFHPVMADVGCRNTVFGAEAQVATKFIGQWIARGFRDFRFEFVHETQQEIKKVVSAFRCFFSGEYRQQELDEQLKSSLKSGTTEGSFFVPIESIRIPRGES